MPRLITTSLTLSALLCLPCAAQDDAGNTSPSLERLAEHYRLKHKQALDAIRPQLEELLTRLKEQSDGGRKARPSTATRDALVKLGSTIVPTLVKQLDPNSKSPGRIRYSSELTKVLLQLNPEASIDELLEMTRKGSSRGKDFAVQVLGVSQSKDRVEGHLIKLYSESKDISKQTLLVSIATLATEDGIDFIVDKLGSEDPEEGKGAIAALVAAKSVAAAPSILKIANSAREASKVIKEICDYYVAVPSVVNKEHTTALLGLTQSKRLSIEDRIRLLDTLIVHKDEWPRDANKTLKQLSEIGNPELREAVLVGLALTGDRGAKKDLIRGYEAAVDENPGYSDAYIDLAEIQYKLRDYRDAKKNFERALAFGRVFGSRKASVHLGLARCCALEKKYKDAEKWLKNGMSSSQILSHVDDPAFAQMREHAKYGEVFREESSD